MEDGGENVEIDLHPHNIETYDKIAQAILDDKNKFAVSHAVGTGKSYLIAKLCSDYNEDKKLILCPLLHIKEQISYLLEQYDIMNVDIMLYQSFINMADKDIVAMNYKVIILDEYHHGTAKVWGNKINTLIQTHSNSIIFGTSATPVRTDGINTIDSLFEGNCISNLPLSEAIARKIVPLPKYVAALYTIDSQFETLREKVKNSVHTDAEKNEFYKQIDAMRFQVEKSYGMPIILNKHINNEKGKYIVFCQNKAHLNDIKDVVIGWFKTAGFKNINSYTVYSTYENKEDDFNNFCNDTGDSLKLLFCINMLNEGLHLKGISGVILLRPTNSHIVFEQQIGRAIEANNTETPIIIDAVNNFNHVGNSVELLKDIKDAVRRIESGESNIDESFLTDIDTFFITESVQNIENICLDIENRILNNWDTMFNELERFYKTNGHCIVPPNYDNKSLYRWVKNQRNLFVKHELTDLQVEKLKTIEFAFNYYNYIWERNFCELREYIRVSKKDVVPADYVTKSGIKLGSWFCRQVGLYRAGQLPKDYEDRLKKIGACLYGRDKQWMHCFEEFKLYIHEHNSPIVRPEFKSLYSWYKNNRHNFNKGTLSKWKVDLLQQQGFSFSQEDYEWKTKIRCLKEYIDKYGTANVRKPQKGESETLYVWVNKQRQLIKNGELSQEKENELLELGVREETNREFTHQQNLDTVKALLESNDKNLSLPALAKKAGMSLGKFNAYKKELCLSKPNRTKRIRCINTGEVFGSIAQAVRWSERTNSGSVVKCLKGRQKHAGCHPITGELLMWEYVNELTS